MKHYNLMALQGATDVTDDEVCQEFKLDPKLAGTPEINEAVINSIHKSNYDNYISKGLSHESAMAIADQRAKNTRQTIKELMR
jgi:hypothetical protein